MKHLLILLFLFPFIVNAQRLFILPQQPIQSPVGFYRAVTIDHTKVPNTDQTNFTVGFIGTYSYLATPGFGGKALNAHGYDITFALDSSGNQPLNWDMESYDSTTGKIVAWIKIPTVSHTTNTVFYVKYGNAAFTTYQGNRTSAWDGNYIAIWHMSDVLTGSGQTVADAIGNLPATSNGTWTSGQQSSGKIGGSLAFINSNSDYLNFTSTTMPSTYTIEGWYNLSTVGNNVFSLGSPLVNGSYGNDINFYGGFTLLFNAIGGGTNITYDTTISPTNTWIYIVFTVNGGTGLAYHNSILTNTVTGSALSEYFQYLGREGNSFTLNMSMDEIRIANVVRSADWIATEYANENSPSTFYNIGVEQ